MTPLVLVHGFLGGSAQWQMLENAIGTDRLVVALDLPGFGKHAELDPINSIEGFANWVIDTLRAQGINRYHLLGHSMGGMIAQEIARTDADAIARLILYGTGAEGALPGRFETIAESKRRARQDGAASTARRIAATWLFERDVAAQYPMVAEIAQRASIEAMAAGFDAMEKWSGKENLNHIGCDTLIVWGDADRTYDWQQTETLWSGIANASLCVMPKCAHLAHLEMPEVFQETVRRFIA